MNVVVLQGTLSSEPRERTLPSGTTVLNWEVTSRSGETAQSVPVQWDDPAAAIRKFTAGDEVVVLGSVRRRFFTAGGATVSRTEVLAERAVRPTAAKAVASLITRASQRLDC